MFTLQELNVLMPLLDAGVRATGLQVFQGGGGVTLQSVLDKLQEMAADAEAAAKRGQSEGAPKG